MSVIFEGKRSVFLGSSAWLIEENRELAWAERHVIRNPAVKYILGRYVESETANENGHIFDLKELETAQRFIVNSPLNMLHRPHQIVGNFIASELVYPVEANAAAEAPLNPYVEALSAFYKYYFPLEFQEVEKAHREGALFYSMECVPKAVKCAAVCGAEFAYDGRQSPTYCAHLNAPGAKKRLREPHFTGGALIIPPVKPGWRRADVTQLSSLMAERAQEAEMAYEQVSKEFSHLDPQQWEQMVDQLMVFAYTEAEGEWARDFSTDKRKQMAKGGTALPDGSYPIATPEDLANAIRAFGRAKPADRDKVKAHIKKRAKALGKTDVIPDAWNS